MSLFTIKRLRVAWKIIRAALGVLTIAAPGSREAKIASVVIALVTKQGAKQVKLAKRYADALNAKGRIDQLVSMYKKELEAGKVSENRLLGAVTLESLTHASKADADASRKEV